MESSTGPALGTFFHLILKPSHSHLTVFSVLSSYTGPAANQLNDALGVYVRYSMLAFPITSLTSMSSVPSLVPSHDHHLHGYLPLVDRARFHAWLPHDDLLASHDWLVPREG
jgi:hypothetical protein